MSDLRWIKLSLNMFDDDKIRIIESLPGGDGVLIIWIRLLVLAGKKNEGGYIYLTEKISYTPDTLASIFNRKPQDIRHALSVLVDFSMIEIDDKGWIYILNWEKHQNIEGLDKIREQTRLRVNKHRDKQKALQQKKTDVTLHETLQKREVTQQNKNKSKKENKNKSKEEEDFIDEIIDLFSQSYFNFFDLDYHIPNKGKERGAAGKIVKLYKGKYPDSTSEETKTGLKSYFDMCCGIQDDWLSKNMSLPMIVHKFNEINKILKNGNSKNGARKTSRQDLANIFAKQFAEDYNQE